jgi:anti-anti-sigma factor
VTILGVPGPSAAIPPRNGRSVAQSPRLELRVQPGGDHAVVKLWGELHADTVGDLVGTAGTLADRGCARVVLDLSRVYDLDAGSVAQLVGLQSLLAEHGGGLWLAGARPWVRQSLQRMGRLDTFAVQPSVADAIAQIKSSPTGP